MCETKCQGGVVLLHHFGRSLTYRYRAKRGIAAIASQYRATPDQQGGGKRSKTPRVTSVITFGPGQSAEVCKGFSYRFRGFCLRLSWGVCLGTCTHQNEKIDSNGKIHETIRRLKIRNLQKKSFPPRTLPATLSFCHLF